jgi:ATP-dependent RNA helicase DDX46/PRP5
MRTSSLTTRTQLRFRTQVEQAVREIKRLLIEASAAALQAEMRNPTATHGRYSVV